MRWAARHQRPMFMVYLRRGSPGTAPSEGEVSLDAQTFVDPPLSGSDSDSGPESVAPVSTSAPSPVGVGRRSPGPRRVDRPSARVVRARGPREQVAPVQSVYEPTAAQHDELKEMIDEF